MSTILAAFCLPVASGLGLRCLVVYKEVKCQLSELLSSSGIE